MLHDRGVDYPITVQRYPHSDTVAPSHQLGGVLMGRFIAAQRAAIYYADFKASVVGILTNAVRRECTQENLCRACGIDLYTEIGLPAITDQVNSEYSLILHGG